MLATWVNTKLVGWWK